MVVKDEFKNLSDRELITKIKESKTGGREFNLLNNELFRRYENQIHKNWHRLKNQMSHTDVIKSLKDEYYAEAYEAFYNALLAVDLKEVRDDKWQFVGYLDFYLKNVRTRLCNQAEKNGKTNTLDALEEEEDKSLDRVVDFMCYRRTGYDEDPSNEVVENDLTDKRRRIVEEAYADWDKTARVIYKLWERGYRKVEIAEALGIKDSIVYTTTERIKKDLQKRANKRNVI